MTKKKKMLRGVARREPLEPIDLALQLDKPTQIACLLSKRNGAKPVALIEFATVRHALGNGWTERLEPTRLLRYFGTTREFQAWCKQQCELIFPSACWEKKIQHLLPRAQSTSNG